ncbi:MAG: AraC family transcriptional regulator [Clostridia bacterium]|nr:AraC family transcriptional regulator [Clostridia bacterium]
MKHQINRPIYIKHKLINVINISKIVTMHYFEFDKNFKYPGERHDFWEMVYVDSGTVHVTAAKNEYMLSQGEVIFHKPNEFHSLSADNKSPSNVFIISFVTTSKNMVFFKNKKTVLPKDLRHYIKILMEEGKKTFELPFNNPEMRELKLCDSSPFGGQQIIRSTLEQLLIMLIRAQEKNTEKTYIFPDKESMDNHLVDSVIKLLNDNIYGKISVDEICRKVNYSKTYVSKIFAKNCGYTIIDYYTRLKIKEAKKLIRKKTYTFTEISNMLCYNNPHYFSRVFKKTANMTPREYLQSVDIH